MFRPIHTIDPEIEEEVSGFIPPSPSAQTYGNRTYLQKDTDAGSGRIDGFPLQHIALPYPLPAESNVARLAQNGSMIWDQQPDYNREGTDAGFSPIDGFPQQHIALSHPWPAGFNDGHPAQNGFMMDGPNLGVQQPTQGPDYNLHACRRGVQRSPGPESTYPPHYSIMQPQVHSDDAQAIPTHLHEVNKGEGSLSHPAGMEGNQSTALFPANSSQAEANLLRNRSRNKEKQRPAPYEVGGGGKKKSKREKKPQDPETLEFIPADSFTPLCGRPDFQAVLQTKYYCESTQKGREGLLPPIDFTVDGNEGIKLTDALNMNYSHLDGRDASMFVDGDAGPSVSLRIEFIEHRSGIEKARQIPTMDHKKNRGPITRQKLGHDIAKIIKLHLEKGDPFHVSFKDMYLVRLHQVSHASWQPELWRKASTTS